MSNLIKDTIIFAVGATLGAYITVFQEVTVLQKGYTQGRESVLNSTVSLGGDNSPCSVRIPLSVLVEMVNVGVLDWHQACLAALGKKERQDR